MAGSQASREAVFSAAHEANVAAQGSAQDGHGDKLDKMIAILGRMAGLSEKQLNEMRGQSGVTADGVLNRIGAFVYQDVYRMNAR